MCSVEEVEEVHITHNNSDNNNNLIMNELIISLLSNQDVITVGQQYFNHANFTIMIM